MVRAVAQYTAPIVRIRQESPARWQAALKRGIAQGLEVLVVADTGERMVTSASKLDTLHRTDGYNCTCEAALSGDPVCQHRAAVRFCLNWLRVEDAPESATQVERPMRPARKPVAACWWCNATGRVPNDYEQRYDACSMCGGTGVKPAPAAEPIAA